MFEYKCNPAAGFVMDPNQHLPFGYVVALNGFGLAATLPKDLQVHLPFNASAAPNFKALTYTGPSSTAPMGVAKVVGVIESFSWEGGTADPIKLEFYVSQENAMQIASLQHLALKTTLVSALGWWLADYDQEDKKWFEQAYPVTVTGAITGHINKRKDPDLKVDLHPVKVRDNIDVNVYKVTLAVVPAGNAKYKLNFASSYQQKVIKSWGILFDK